MAQTIKKLWWLLPVATTLYFAPWALESQTPTNGQPAFHYVTQLPTGACVGTPPIQINYFTGQAVVCANGVWTPLGGAGSGTGNINGTLTAGTLVDATGTNTIASSIGTDNGVTLNYPGTGGISSTQLIIGSLSSGNYARITPTDGIGNYYGIQFNSTQAAGTTMDATGVYSQNVEGVYMQTGNFLASGTMTLGLMQNNNPGQPINIVQNGGSALTLNVEGGLGVTNGIQGQATEPTGSCTTSGLWAFTQDGHASVCLAGTWTQKI